MANDFENVMDEEIDRLRAKCDRAEVVIRAIVRVVAEYGDEDAQQIVGDIVDRHWEET